MQQAIIWTNANPIYWRIFAAVGGDELMSLPDDDFCARGKYLGYGWMIAPHSKLSDVITYLCPIYLLLAPKSPYINVHDGFKSKERLVTVYKACITITIFFLAICVWKSVI